MLGGLWLFPIIFSKIYAETDSYVASSVDKESRLKSIKSPKLILVGGSGTAFSVNSKTLADSLKIPVVNMAIAYGVGLKFMLEEIKSEIKKGDKVLIMTEYHLPIEGNTKLLTLINEVNPDASRFFKFDIQQWILFRIINFQRIGSTLFYKIKNKETIEKTSLRSSYNSYGDMVIQNNEPNIRPLKDKGTLPTGSYLKQIKLMNEFVELAIKNGADVFYCFPAYPKTEYKINYGALVRFEKEMKYNFKGKLIGTVQENLFEENDFYDTIYHLNSNGREKRTQYLIENLKSN